MLVGEVAVESLINVGRKTCEFRMQKFGKLENFSRKVKINRVFDVDQ